jgi:hypothetical protein
VSYEITQGASAVELSNGKVIRHPSVSEDTDVVIATMLEGKKIAEDCNIKVLKDPADIQAPYFLPHTNGYLQIGETSVQASITVSAYEGASLSDLEELTYEGLTFGE